MVFLQTCSDELLNPSALKGFELKIEKQNPARIVETTDCVGIKTAKFPPKPTKNVLFFNSNVISTFINTFIKPFKENNMAGKFEIKKATNGEFLFNLLAGNGQIILSSELYKAKASAQNGIESVRKNCGDDNRFTRDLSNSNKPYFTLKARNGEIIGRSQMYASEESRDNGIASVKNHAPDATVVDLSVA
jgi:uncharacterized protein